MRTIYFEVSVPKVLLLKALRPVWPGMVWSSLSPSHFAEIPEPTLPGPRWIRVRNHQCGICASDLMLLYAKVDPRTSLAAAPGRSRIYLGHEVVSEVVEVGEEVTRVKPGDRVVMDSRFQGPTCLTQGVSPPCRHCREGNYGLCEYQSESLGPLGVGGGWSDGYTAHETEVYPIPSDLTDDQAVLIEPYSVAVHAVLRRAPQLRERALIIGAGAIGLMTLSVARVIAPEADLSIMARYPHQVEMAERLGADRVIAGGATEQIISQITGGKAYAGPMGSRAMRGGFDVIYDCVGSAHTIQDALHWTRAGGTVVVVGISPVMMTLDLSPIWNQEVNLLGSYVHGTEIWEGTRLHTYDLVIRWMREGRLVTDGFITHRFPLEEYKRAITVAGDKRKEQSIRVLLQM